MSTRGKMMEKILDKKNLFCIDKKEETYYRAFDSSKLTIDLTIASLTIALEKVSLHETTTEMEHWKSKLDAVSD